MLAASAYDWKVALHENDGDQSFTERVISTHMDYAHFVFAADLDSDLYVDVLAAAIDLSAELSLCRAASWLGADT